MPEDYNRNNYNDNYYDNNDVIYSSSSKQNYDDIYSDSSKRQKVSPKPPKRRKKSTGKKVFTTILVIILVLLISIAVYALLVVSRINYDSDSPDSEYIEEIVGTLKSDPNIENIMLFGADNHAENENGRSDSMILLSIDKNTKTLKLTSFLRDLYLPIPGYGEGRLNSAYSYGGASLAVETIEYNFGIKIDKYAVVDFESFTAIIDTLGGIDLELTADEIDYINWQCWKNKQVETRNELDVNDYTFYTNDDGYEVATVHLNGRQALWYARDRNSAGSDFDRTSRQRIVINTIFSQLKSADPITLMRLVYDIAPMVTTNLSTAEVISLGANMISYLKYDTDEFRIPTSYNYSNTVVYGAQVLTINDMELEKQYLYEFVFEDEA